MNNRELLIDMMSRHGLDRREVAELLKVNRDTVDRWLLTGESARRELVPDMAIELLELKLAREQPPAPH
jgi:plasmid maintenance system antidote protein VapI